MARRFDFPAPARPLRRAVGIGDDQLVEAAQHGDRAAYNRLLRRYHQFAAFKARQYFLTGGDHDDLVQEAMIGVCHAVRDYQPDRESSFRNFAELCATRQIITAIKTATRGKHTTLNRAIPLDAPLKGIGDSDDLTVADTIPLHVDPFEQAATRDELLELTAHLTIVLTRREAAILARVVDGRSYQTIARELGCDTKSVDNALQRAKRKAHLKLAEMAA